MPKKMTWDEFSGEYCKRQEQTPNRLAMILESQIQGYESKGFMLLECQQLDSSRIGQYTILGFGGNHSYASIPDHPISPRGLASDMSVCVGYIDAADVPE